MGFLDNAFKKLKVEAKKALKEINNNNDKSDDVPSSRHDNVSLTMSEVMHYGSHATRWEKTVVATNSIVGEVTKFDPDGVEIFCVGGESPDGSLDNDEIEWHKGIKNTQGLEDTITTRNPGGPCPLGKTMEQVLEKALENDLKETPCSVLVLTAGRPDDSDLLEETLQSAAQKVADSGGVAECPLSVTFIQIGNDEDASDYLKYLDKKMVGICDETGEKIDIVDTMGFHELKDTMDSMREHSFEAEKAQQSGKHGAILGAVTGAAIGAGGVYLYGQQKAKKRIKSGSWGGRWKCCYEDEEITTLTVKDDGAGNLTIDGLEDTMQGIYLHDDGEGAAADSDDFFIRFTEPSGELVEGTLDAENFVLHWSDGTRWEALDEQHASWTGYLGAAMAGAAALGVTGYAIDKKFFRKVGRAEPCDYVLVLDRSAKMAITDGRA